MNALIEKKFQICGHEIIVNVPAREEDCLEQAVAGTGIDPYWGKIWDASQGSACCILAKAWPAGTRAIELGCGLGLAGIAALKAGLDVTFTDHDPSAVELALRNAAANGFPGARGKVLAWSESIDTRFDVCLASDVLYESGSHAALLAVAGQALKPAGVFCVGDPGRRSAREFLGTASEAGWKVQLFDQQMNKVLTPSTNAFQWIELRRD